LYLLCQRDNCRNLKVARALFPHVRSEFVLFGINADEFASVKKEKVHDPVRIRSLGNDPNRDWQVLIRAIKDFLWRIESIFLG
jgi:hypothetical protein